MFQVQEWSLYYYYYNSISNETTIALQYWLQSNDYRQTFTWKAVQDLVIQWILFEPSLPAHGSAALIPWFHRLWGVMGVIFEDDFKRCNSIVDTWVCSQCATPLSQETQVKRPTTLLHSTPTKSSMMPKLELVTWGMIRERGPFNKRQKEPWLPLIYGPASRKGLIDGDISSNPAGLFAKLILHFAPFRGTIATSRHDPPLQNLIKL